MSQSQEVEAREGELKEQPKHSWCKDGEQNEEPSSYDRTPNKRNNRSKLDCLPAVCLSLVDTSFSAVGLGRHKRRKGAGVTTGVKQSKESVRTARGKQP